MYEHHPDLKPRHLHEGYLQFESGEWGKWDYVSVDNIDRNIWRLWIYGSVATISEMTAMILLRCSPEEIRQHGKKIMMEELP